VGDAAGAAQATRELINTQIAKNLSDFISSS
jgi:hypothetical protein